MPVTSAADPALSPDVGRYQPQLEALRRDALALTSDLTETQLDWRSVPDRWSIAQCLWHLVLTARQYAPGVDAAIEEARRRGEEGKPAYRPGMIANWLVRSMEPPPRFRVKTFRIVEPPPRLAPSDVTREFFRMLDVLGGQIQRAQSVHPDRGRMRSPFFNVLRLTVDQAIRLQLGHARRHLWQAWQVRKTPSFPAP